MPFDVAHFIQLAIAPVFLLAGIGAFMNVMTNRLGRVVDRWRSVEKELEGAIGPARQRHVAELSAIDTRMIRINRAILFATASALMICLDIVTLFAGQLTGFGVRTPVATMFILSMSLLIVGLIYFLLEIRVATKTLRVSPHLLKRPPDA